MFGLVGKEVCLPFNWLPYCNSYSGPGVRPKWRRSAPWNFSPLQLADLHSSLKLFGQNGLRSNGARKTMHFAEEPPLQALFFWHSIRTIRSYGTTSTADLQACNSSGPRPTVLFSRSTTMTKIVPRPHISFFLATLFTIAAIAYFPNVACAEAGDEISAELVIDEVEMVPVTMLRAEQTVEASPASTCLGCDQNLVVGTAVRSVPQPVSNNSLAPIPVEQTAPSLTPKSTVSGRTYAPSYVQPGRSLAPVVSEVAPFPMTGANCCQAEPVAVTRYPDNPCCQSPATAVASPVSSQPVVAYAPAVIESRYQVGRGIIGQPKLYVRGQPIRNALRWITP